MALDKDKKIEVQQKLIEQLTKENGELKEQLLYEQSKSEDNNEKYKLSIKEYQQAKNKYEELVEELEKLKADYRIRYDICRKLTEK